MVIPRLQKSLLIFLWCCNKGSKDPVANAWLLLGPLIPIQFADAEHFPHATIQGLWAYTMGGRQDTSLRHHLRVGSCAELPCVQGAHVAAAAPAVKRDSCHSSHSTCQGLLTLVNSSLPSTHLPSPHQMCPNSQLHLCWGISVPITNDSRDLSGTSASGYKWSDFSLSGWSFLRLSMWFAKQSPKTTGHTYKIPLPKHEVPDIYQETEDWLIKRRKELAL